MLTYQELISSVEALSSEDQDNLIQIIHVQRENKRGDDFWNGLQKLRIAIESEQILFDDDFSDLRDREPGREVNL